MFPPGNWPFVPPGMVEGSKPSGMFSGSKFSGSKSPLKPPGKLPEPPPGKKHYSIGIRRPAGRNGSVMPGILHLPGGTAVSSSGDYHRNILLEGKRFGHIIDPATGIPAPGKVAVTAAADSGIRSDWLSTAVYLRGNKLAEKLKKEFPDSKFIIIKK